MFEGAQCDFGCCSVMEHDDENDPLSLHVERPIYQQDDLNRESLYAKPDNTSE